MGYTNKTSHYELPQYVASDKPSWLGDFNSAMLSIDTAIAGAAADAATASSQAGAADTQVKNLNVQVTKIQSDMSGVTEIATNAQGAADAANTAAQQALTAANNAVPKSGAVMTGSLFLNADPTGSMQAATKQYVDAQVGAGGNALQKSGGTMTGPLYLSGAPTQDNQAATKKYVDEHGGSGVPFVKTANVDGFSNAGGVALGKTLVMNGVLSPISNIDAGTEMFQATGNPFGLAANTPVSFAGIFLTATSFTQATVIGATVTFDGVKTVVKNLTQISANGLTFVSACVQVSA